MRCEHAGRQIHSHITGQQCARNCRGLSVTGSSVPAVLLAPSPLNGMLWGARHHTPTNRVSDLPPSRPTQRRPFCGCAPSACDTTRPPTMVRWASTTAANDIAELCLPPSRRGARPISPPRRPHPHHNESEIIAPSVASHVSGLPQSSCHSTQTSMAGSRHALLCGSSATPGPPQH